MSIRLRKPSCFKSGIANSYSKDWALNGVPVPSTGITPLIGLPERDSQLFQLAYPCSGSFPLAPVT